MNVLYIYLAVYIIGIMGVSWITSRKEGSEGFLIADRDRKWWMISLSKFAGSIGVSYFVAYTGYAYEFGTSVYLFFIGTLLGFGIFGLWAAPKLYKYSRENKFYTQGDFTKHVTESDTVMKLTNFMSSLILFSWLMVGTIGGAKIISHFGLMSYELALFSTMLVIVSYILIAGYRAIIITDILQSAVIATLMVILTYVMIGGVGIGEILSVQTGSVDIATAAGFLIFGVLSVFSGGNFYQLVYSAKSAKAASRGIAFAVVPIAAVASMLLLIGMYMQSQVPGLEAELVFIEALAHHVPAALLPVSIVLFFAGLMSSADTNIYGIASHYVLTKKTSNPVHNIRYVTIILGVCMLAIGFFFRNVVDMTLVAAGLTVIPSVAMIYIIAGGKNSNRFIGSIVGGVIGFGVGLVTIGLNPAVTLIILAGTLLGLVYNKKVISSQV